MIIATVWAESKGALDISLSLVICFQLPRGSPGHASTFTGQLVKMRITQQNRAAFISKVSFNYGMYTELLIKLVAMEISATSVVCTKTGEKS